jgi:hypothetical protein
MFPMRNSGRHSANVGIQRRKAMNGDTGVPAFAATTTRGDFMTMSRRSYASPLRR